MEEESTKGIKVVLLMDHACLIKFLMQPGKLVRNEMRRRMVKHCNLVAECFVVEIK